jgi:hypothetical protein
MNTPKWNFTKTAVATLLIMLCTSATFAQSNFTDDEKAIRAVIQSAYVEGLQNWGNIADIEAGFHPTFELLTKTNDNKIIKLPIGKWIESVKARKAQNPDGPGAPVIAEIHNIDITVEAAAVKLDLLREGKKLFTDYLLLYKFEEGWRIVGKIYYRIPG